MKIRVGITGKAGFIGTHLYNSLGLFPDEFEQIHYDTGFFNDSSRLEHFVSECDVIVHLAALNRHSEPQVIYDTNIGLVTQLINALNATQSKAHIIFSSSTQEDRDNMYGKSKRMCRELFISWAETSGGKFSGLVIPNVFGSFGKPYYNSFIATFSHQLTHNEQPKIEVDGSVKLIYIDDLANIIIKQIRQKESTYLLNVAPTNEYRVSEILAKLESYKQDYFLSGIIPELNSPFELNLFNTFRSYIDIQTYYPVKLKLKQNTDAPGGQLSTTDPGITIGNHFYIRKIERIIVIKGKALVQLRKIGTDKPLDFYLDGNQPAYIDIPIWHTYTIKNMSNDVLCTNFLIYEYSDMKDVDIYQENV